MSKTVFTIAIIILGAVVLLVIGGIAVALLFTQTSTQPSTKTVNEKIWTIKIYDLEEKAVDLSKYKGKILVIDFFATWCGPCAKQLEELKKLLASRSDVHIVSISISPGTDTPEKLKKYVEDHKITWPVYIDKNRSMTKLFSISAVPTLVIIGPSGKYIIRVGLTNHKTLNELINKVKD